MRRAVFYVPAQGGAASGPADGAPYRNRGLDALRDARRRVAAAPVEAIARALAAPTPASRLVETIRDRHNAEHACSEWVDMYELCAEIGDIAALGNEAGVIKSFHNGESGSTVSAVQHYLLAASTQRRVGFTPCRLDWRAANRADRFDLRRVPDRARWVVDAPDDTWPRALPCEHTSGELADARSVRTLSRRATRGGLVDLYTGMAMAAHAGELPCDSEALNIREHVGQAACGLLCLRGGGAMAVRCTGWETPLARALIGALADHFDACRVVRPVAMACAAGAYIVCTGYQRQKARAARLADRLIAALGTGEPVQGYEALSAPVNARLSDIATDLTHGLARSLTELCKNPAARAAGEGDYCAMWLREHPIIARPAKR